MKLLFIIGPTASGKTTFGQKLAKKKKIPFIDLDTLIESRAGIPVEKIIRSQGLKTFRKYESRALSTIDAEITYKGIVAVGAGIVERRVNYWYMRTKGIIIQLPITLSRQRSRLTSSEVKKRALLRNGVRSKLRKMAVERNILYKRWSNIKMNGKEV